jgi:hypothetical protein
MAVDCQALYQRYQISPMEDWLIVESKFSR